MRANLLQETVDSIHDSGHTIEDIVFIGSEDGEYSCTWEEFVALADCEYDVGYGPAHVAQDLIVRFSDGRRMWRGEADGIGWWNHDPKEVDYSRPGKPIQTLIGGDSIAGLHSGRP